MFMEERRGEKSKKVSQVVRPFQPNEENSQTIRDTPPQNLPPLPDWRKTIDIDLNIGVDRAFELFFTDNEFYKNWIHVSLELQQHINSDVLFKDPRRPGEPKNLRIPSWKLSNDSKMQEREVTYELFQDFVITKALINVTVKQVSIKTKICMNDKIFKDLIRLLIFIILLKLRKITLLKTHIYQSNPLC